MKFSIITITYNRAHLIEETIQSVLDQTYQNFEMIIVDDGSTDNTKYLISNYIEKYNNKFRYIYCDRIGKPSVLRNIAIDNASGEILTILDSDDLWLPTKLEEMYTIFSERKEVQFVFHNLRHFFKIDQPTKPYYRYSSSFYRNILCELLKGEILAFPVFSLRQSLIKEIGPVDENVIEGQNEYYLKTAALYKIYYHNEPLTLMRRHDQNLTKNFDIIHTLDTLRTYDNLQKRKLLTLKEYTEASNFISFKIAKHYFKAKRNKKGLEYLNAIFNRSSFLNKWYLKSLLLRFKTYF